MLMNIDKNKILNAKKKLSPIEESFNVLKQSDTPVNRMLFMENYRKQPVSVIRENLSYLHAIPTVGTNMLHKVLKTTDFNVNELKNEHTTLESFINKLEDAEYINEEHLKELKESLSLIDSLIENKNDINTIREEVLMDLYTDRANSNCIFESHLVDDLEVIIYNIDYNPETITDYELLVRQIKMSHTTEYVSSFPQLIDKNTLLITSMDSSLSGTPRDLITSLPVVIADKLVELKIPKTNIKAYLKILNAQKAKVYKELKSGDNRKYVIYKSYLDNINKATDILNRYCGVVKESIAEMQPDIVMYDECCVEDIVAELEETIANLIFDDSEELDEKLVENLVRLEKSLNHAYAKQSEILEEESKVVKGALGVTTKAQKAVRKAVHKGKQIASDVKRVVDPVKKIKEPFINAINNTINNIKKKDFDERRNRIITGQYRFKLVNFIRKGITLIAAGKLIGAAHPIIAIITLLAGAAIDKNLDERARRSVLTELEGELKMVDEKIDDAKGDGNRKEKYELMRIKQKLEKDISRIKYRIENDYR